MVRCLTCMCMWTEVRLVLIRERSWSQLHKAIAASLSLDHGSTAADSELPVLEKYRFMPVIAETSIIRQSEVSAAYQIEEAWLSFTPPVQLLFGAVPIVGPAQEQTIEIANVSASPIQIDSIALLDQSSIFELTDQGTCGSAPVVVQPESSCLLVVRFTPEAPRSYNNLLEVNLKDQEGTYKYTIRGEGSDTLFWDRFNVD